MFIPREKEIAFRSICHIKLLNESHQPNTVESRHCINLCRVHFWASLLTLFSSLVKCLSSATFRFNFILAFLRFLQFCDLLRHSLHDLGVLVVDVLVAGVLVVGILGEITRLFLGVSGGCGITVVTVELVGDVAISTDI